EHSAMSAVSAYHSPSNSKPRSAGYACGSVPVSSTVSPFVSVSERFEPHARRPTRKSGFKGCLHVGGTGSPVRGLPAPTIRRVSYAAEKPVRRGAARSAVLAGGGR